MILGGDAHTPRGLMKANWDRTDYQSMNQNDCRFTAEQVRRLAGMRPVRVSGVVAVVH